MRKKIFYVILFTLFSTCSFAQTVLLNVDRPNENKEETHGPNLKKFSHLFIRGGILISKDKAGARIIYGPSVNLAFGVRRKYKISPAYSMGYEIETQYTDYKFRQENEKFFPDTVINNISQRLDYSALSIGYYNRINLDPSRGNFLGTFIDAGISGSWDFSIKTISKNKLNDGTVKKITVRHLPYVNNFNAKVFARIGFSHISVFISYRLTDLFTSSAYPDMPRIITGFDLAVF
jgi:hypothetical protein